MKIKIIIDEVGSKKGKIIADTVGKYTSKNKLQKAIGGENLLDVVSKSKRKAMFKELADLGVINELITYIEENKNGIPVDYEHSFVYNDVYKKVFLAELGEDWELVNALSRAFDAMQGVEKFEKKFGRDLLDFNTEQVVEVIKYINDDMKYYRTKFQVNVFARYEKFWGDKYNFEEGGKNWESHNSKKAIMAIFGKSVKKELITLEQLQHIYSMSMNPQNAILPILIFLGVKLADKEEVDEVRKLKIEDVHKDKIIVREPTDPSKINRIIPINNTIYQMIFLAANQQFAFKNFSGTITTFPYVESEYVIKPINVKTKRNPDKKVDDGAITYRGAYERMLNLRSQAESLEYDLEFTVSHIVRCGKVASINQAMEEGYDIYDAVRKALMLFGEWKTTGDYVEEKKLQTNRQLVNRQKRDYVMLTGNQK